MITIKEKKRGNQTFYQVYTDASRKYQEICYRTLKKDISNQEWLLIYTPQMAPISEAFVFLNYTSAGQSIHTRMKSMQALKFLYSYQAIIKKEFLRWDVTDIKCFKWFLKGIPSHGTIWNFELITIRNNRTINGYLAVYRQYFRYLGFSEHILLQTTKTYLDINTTEWNCLMCFHFVTMPDRLPFFEEQIKRTDITIHNSECPHDKEEVEQLSSVNFLKEELSVSEIAKEIGCSRTTFYNHNQLLKRYIEYSIEQMNSTNPFYFLKLVKEKNKELNYQNQLMVLRDIQYEKLKQENQALLEELKEKEK